MPLPQVIGEMPPLGQEGTAGIVIPSFEEGSIFLKDGKGEILRLTWEQIEGADPVVTGSKEVRAGWRPVPPGTYAVAGYRVLRKDDHGDEWILSGLNPGGVTGHHPLTIVAGQKQRIPIDDSINLGIKGLLNGKEQFVVQGSIQGPNKTGLTIYRSGKRIPMSYCISKPGRDAPLEVKKMNYG